MKNNGLLWLAILVIVTSFAPRSQAPMHLYPSSTTPTTSLPQIVLPTPFVDPVSQPQVTKSLDLKVQTESVDQPNNKNTTRTDSQSVDLLADVPEAVRCELTLAPPCKHSRPNQLPPAPIGYRWERLERLYTFSAYVHALEESYRGDRLDVPGIQGVQAKEGFLYGVDGLGMQGGGFIYMMNIQGEYEKRYIRYISGHWELDGEDVIISNQWVYAKTGKAVDTKFISKILLADGRFSLANEPNLTPYYSVAASRDFKIGDKLYVPGLVSYGGIFEVQDRGGAFGPNSQRFDLFVGNDMSRALEWIRLGPARSNLVVYRLVANE
ncbi:MAG: hypothetical protein PHQ40_05535 [Anaerolineaceae bacterium]|nr:hypothetical protein [Anaerolineaceae bacterium]